MKHTGAVAAGFGERDEASQELGEVAAVALPGPGHIGGAGE